MEELIDTLKMIAKNVDGNWMNLVLIDNDTENELVDAYNEGVKAMANQVYYFIDAILTEKKAKKLYKEVGDK